MPDGRRLGIMVLCIENGGDCVIVEDNNSKKQSPHSPEEMKRLKEVAAMVKSGERSDILRLKELALHDSNPKIRYYAKKGLLILKRKSGTMPPGDTVRTIDPNKVIIFLKDPDPEKRMKALKAIVRHKLTDLVQEAADLIPDEKDIKVKATIASLLGKMGLPEHLLVLLPLLKDNDSRVRANTIAACVRLDIEHAAPDIIPLLKDEDNRCRANAVAALKEIGSREVIDTLRGMLASHEVHMQESAAFVLDVFPFNRVKSLLSEGARSEFAIIRNRIRAVLEQFADEGEDEAAELFMTLYPQVDEGKPISGADKTEPDRDEAEEIFDRLGELGSMYGESQLLKQRQATDDQMVDNLEAISQESFTSYETIVQNENEKQESMHKKLYELEDMSADAESNDTDEDEPLLKSFKALSETTSPANVFSYEREIDIKPKLESTDQKTVGIADPSEEVFEKLRNIG